MLQLQQQIVCIFSAALNEHFLKSFISWSEEAETADRSNICKGH